MKKCIIVAVLIGPILLAGCDPAITFDKPQPDGVTPLSSFPARLQGQYTDTDQASVLTITDQLITRHYDFDFKEHKDSLDTSYQLTGDTLINLRDGTKEHVVLQGDSIVRHESGTDTLFNISADNVLKKFKGYCFLNSRQDNDRWTVNKLALEKGVLIIGSLSAGEDLQKLNEITETPEDTVSKPFTLTRRQFKRFIRQGGFSDQETFRRISGSR